MKKRPTRSNSLPIPALAAPRREASSKRAFSIPPAARMGRPGPHAERASGQRLHVDSGNGAIAVPS